MTLASLLLATIVPLGLFPQQPKFSLFASDVIDSAKTSGHTVREAVSTLKAVGIAGFDSDYAEPTIDELKAAGLTPVNFYGSMRFLTADGGKAQSEAFVASAVRHGVKRIMIIPDDFTDGRENEAEFAKMTAGLKTLAAAAQAKGIVPMVETFGGVKNPCSHVKYLRRFLQEVPGLCFALDSGNLHYADRGEDILAFAKEVGKERIRHVHLKDFKAVHSREYVTLGTGAVPNEQVVRFVDGFGYDGWYTLENPVGENLLADVIRQHEMVMRWCTFCRSPDYAPEG